MAGHSHWAGIKHKKALIDNKRGKIWSKIAKQIIVAARMGGGDPDANPRLRLAIADAKSARMPKDNIDRAIKKGTGELDGGNVESVLYEGYGSGGVAVMCDILTDNRNRTAPEIRKIFEVNDGKLGATGCVNWMFERRGRFCIDDTKIGEERLMEVALEAGALDVRHDDGQYEVLCEVDSYTDVSDALDAAGVEIDHKELAQVPSNTVDIEDVDTAKKVLKLMDMLDDHDDVENVSANFNIPDDAMAALEEE